MGRLDGIARSFLLTEIVAGFALTLSYMFKPKVTVNYCGFCQEACPVDAIVEGPNLSSRSRRARSCTTTRRSCSITAIAGSRSRPPGSRRMRRTDNRSAPANGQASPSTRRSSSMPGPWSAGLQAARPWPPRRGS